MMSAFSMLRQLRLVMKKSKKTSQIISNLLPFKNRYNWDKVKYQSGKNEFCNFEKNNHTIVRNVLYVKEIEVCAAFISNYNLSGVHLIILMALNSFLIVLFCSNKIVFIVTRNEKTIVTYIV